MNWCGMSVGVEGGGGGRPFSRRRVVFPFLLLVLGGLVAANGYLVVQNLGRSGGEVEVFRQEIVEVGGEVAVGFRLVNDEDREMDYFYSVVLSVAEERVLSDSVSVPPGRVFEYTVRFVPEMEGVVEMVVSVYRGEELIEAQTLFIEVGSG